MVGRGRDMGKGISNNTLNYKTHPNTVFSVVHRSIHSASHVKILDLLLDGLPLHSGGLDTQIKHSIGNSF